MRITSDKTVCRVEIYVDEKSDVNKWVYGESII